MENDVLAAIRARREEEENQRESELRTLLGGAEACQDARGAAGCPCSTRSAKGHQRRLV